MAVDYFLKIAGVDGESQDVKHKGEIDILSFSWGEANSASAAHGGSGGAGVGKVSMQDFHFTAKFSKASPKLFQSTASGKHFSEAVLTVRKAGEVPLDFLKWTMSNLLISSYQTSGAGEPDPLPTDQFSINFQKIRVDLLVQNPGGTVVGSVNADFDLRP